MLKAWKKIIKLFDRKQKKRLLVLFLLMLIGAAFEVMSVSMIVPVVAGMMGEGTETGSVLTGLAAVFVLVIVKTVFLWFEYKAQYRFVYENRFRVQKEMLHAYLCRPYEYYLQAQTGEILRVIQRDAETVFNLLQTMLGAATDVIISAALAAAVFVISPGAAVFAAVFLLAAVLVIAKVIKPAQMERGKRRNILTAKTNQWLLQAVSGIRELKIGRKEPYFEERYLAFGEEAVKIDQKRALLGNVPKLLIEMVSLCAILAVFAFFALQGVPLETMIPRLSALAMAAVKLLPCANRIAVSASQSAYAADSLEKVSENLFAIPDGASYEAGHPQNGETLPFEREIALCDVTYRYPGTEREILANVSLRIPKGSAVGITGVSGIGKTTAVDILTGLLAPVSGTVAVDGTDIRENYGGWLARIGYIPQTVFLMDDTIRANIAFGIPEEAQEEEKIWKALERAQLASFVKSLPDGLDTGIGERGIRLSGGQRQRIGIARALYPDPDVLIFDEATSSLDRATEAAVIDSVYLLSEEKTVVIISHRQSITDRCDTVYEVCDRKIRKVRGT